MVRRRTFRRIGPALAVVVLLGITFSSPASAATGSGTVSGVVMVGPINQPCSNCYITVWDPTTNTALSNSTYTAANGSYSLSLPPGTYDIGALPYNGEYNSIYNYYSWYGSSVANGVLLTPVTVSAGSTQNQINITEVGMDSTSVSTSVTSAAPGTPVTLTATVTPDQSSWNAPQGTVDFIDSATVLATATLNSNGVATATLNNLVSGTYEINAVYLASPAYFFSGSNGAWLISPTESPVLPTGATVITITGGTTPTWLYALNYYRARFGLPPVTQDPVLTAQIKAHVNYMNLNDPSLSLGDHYEDPSAPGYTVAGAYAGSVSSLAAGANVAYVAPAFLHSAYHFGSVLNPYARVMGAYGGGEYSGLEPDGVAWSNPVNANYPLVWPPNGSTTTTLGFNPGSEGPNPSLQCSSAFSSGDGPVLLMELKQATVTNTASTITITGSNGITDPTCQVLPIYQEAASSPNEIEDVSLLTEYPLTPGVTYTVSISGAMPAFSWSFTAKAPNFLTGIQPYNPPGIVGVPYPSLQMINTGGVPPFTTQITSGLLLPGYVAGLPPGLTFDPSTMTISGTPTTAGHYEVYITTTDSSVPLPQVSTFIFLMTISPAKPPSITPTAPLVSIASTPHGNGYWEADAAGEVFPFGSAQYYGSMAGITLNQPVTHIVATPDGKGYWLVAKDGGVFSFGDAKFYGSMGGKPLNKPVVSMTPTPDNGGYWLVASDGGVFSFGDAQFYGSMGGKPLNQPVDGIVATSAGYFEVASDGGVFAFGNATFAGSLPGLGVSVTDIVGIAPSGSGYWLVASDGGIFSIHVPFYGSEGGGAAGSPIVGMAAIPGGSGYWEIASNGNLYSYGSAQYFGSVSYVPPGP